MKLKDIEQTLKLINAIVVAIVLIIGIILNIDLVLAHGFELIILFSITLSTFILASKSRNGFWTKNRFKTTMLVICYISTIIMITDLMLIITGK